MLISEENGLAGGEKMGVEDTSEVFILMSDGKVSRSMAELSL